MQDVKINSLGGIKALKELGIEADIYHFNDSHPVLAGIELIREYMDEEGMYFEEAWEKTRTLDYYGIIWYS